MNRRQRVGGLRYQSKELTCLRHSSSSLSGQFDIFTQFCYTEAVQPTQSSPGATLAGTRASSAPRVTETILKIKQVKSVAVPHFLSPQGMATPKLGEEQCGNCVESTLQNQIPMVHQEK